MWVFIRCLLFSDVGLYKVFALSEVGLHIGCLLFSEVCLYRVCTLFLRCVFIRYLLFSDVGLYKVFALSEVGLHIGCLLFSEVGLYRVCTLFLGWVFIGGLLFSVTGISFLSVFTHRVHVLKRGEYSLIGLVLFNLYRCSYDVFFIEVGLLKIRGSL